MVILVDEGLHDVIQQNLSIPYSRHYFCAFWKAKALFRINEISILGSS